MGRGERERAQRNLNPHAEARLAMVVWGHEYSQQNGGCMDFWDGLSEARKRLCADVVDGIIEAKEQRGRANVSR